MKPQFALKEIAFQSGLSIATVDRVVHQRANVSPSAVRRVAMAIQELEKQYENAKLNGRRFVIDIVMQAPKRFTSVIRKAFEAELPTMKPASFGARFHTAQTMSSNEVLQIIMAIKRRGSHGVLLKLPNTVSTNELAATLISSNIPVVTYVTDISSDNRISYVGMNNKKAGATAAFLVGKMLPMDNARILLALSSGLFDGEEQRALGFQETISDQYPHLQTAVVSEGMGISRSTYRGVVQALEFYQDIRAVYSIGGANQAIIDAFKTCARSYSVFAAHDLDAANTGLLGSGQIDFVLHHDFRSDARHLCQIFLAYHRMGRAPELGGHSALHIATPIEFMM